MKRWIFLIVYISLINTSCKELFSPELKISTTPLLVVDGLITDEAKPYIIKLSRALTYDNNVRDKYTRVTKATVVVFDDCGHTYHFKELATIGEYVSDPAEFVGVPGRSYMLYIKTIDNIQYRSAPQLLLPNDFTVKVDAEYGTRDQLIEDVYGRINKVTLSGTNIFYTIENNEDSVSRFRFDYKTYEQYIEIYEKGATKCWLVLKNNDNINLTNDYGTSTNNIEKHTVCFLPKIKDENYGDYIKVADKLITKVSHYRLNNETYQFYKDNNKVLAATGKMFDPMPLQVRGNITCTSYKNIDALGFFEASSVRVRYFGLSNGSKIIHNLSSYNPPSDYGCLSVKDDWGWIWNW